MKWIPVGMLLLAATACRSTIESVETDADGDGIAASEDCNDTDETIFPGADELCDGVDNDCNGVVDDDALDASEWLRDGDRDGYGDDSDVVLACEAPADRVLAGGDCDDADDDIHPDGVETCDGVDEDCDGLVDNDAIDGDTFYTDADGDGLGDPESAFVACALPDGASLTPTDCNDGDDQAFPGAPERCNGLDDDCDGDIDDNAGDTTLFYVDIDGDGFGSAALTEEACAAPPGFTDNAQDCDDARADAFPGSVETCNELDDDCDGEVDEDATDPSDFYLDVDGDGFGDPEAVVMACALPEGAVQNAADCDDTRVRVFPGGTELCNDLDDDCNGLVDDDPANPNTYWVDADADGFGQAGGASVEACAPPQGYARNTSDCDDTTAAVAPGVTETCNSIDDDCDGDVDENAADASTFYGDSDGDSFGSATVTVRACEQPDGFVSNSTDCNDGDALAFPQADERCNRADDDCDGEVDEDAVDQRLFYADDDGDRYGDPDSTVESCFAPVGYVGTDDDCDDTRALTFPGAPEVCNDLDDDCDGVVDDDPIDGDVVYVDGDGDGFGQPGTAPLRVCDPDGYADNADDCDDSDPLSFPGGSGDCTVAECPADGDEGLVWIATESGESFQAWCDGDGWMRVAHLEAGPREQGSVYRGDRFLTVPFVQGLNQPSVAASNSGVVLDGETFGMLEVSDFWDDAAELRIACEDNTRGHTASGVVDLADLDRDALLANTTYATTTTPILFTYDAVSSTPSVYMTWSNAGYRGSWHICGSGSDAQASSPAGWQVGFCHNAPGESDEGLMNIDQVAMGFHPGFTGIRLECGNDTPSNTARLDGTFSMWLR